MFYHMLDHFLTCLATACARYGNGDQEWADAECEHASPVCYSHEEL